MIVPSSCRCARVFLFLISFTICGSAQTCHIITSTGRCSSVNVNFPGVSGTGSAVCTTTGVYGNSAGVTIGPIFLTVIANQSCPAGSGIVSVTQRASTSVDLGDTAIDGLRSSVVDDNSKTLFRSHGEEDCATGFSETIDVDDPSACTPPPPSGGGGGSSPGCDPTSQTCVCASVPLQGPDGTLIMECDPGTSPIIVDTTGQGFHLTSAADGVLFDMAGTGNPLRIGWTAPGSGNAFLALPDSSGVVKNGTQLFGNFTPQPPSPRPNGFLALTVYDKPDHGGDNDGVIDDKDQIFSSLRLWIDENHDGICQPEELHKLPDLGVLSIDLTYSLSHRVDQFGNVFRYRADVNSGIPGKVSTVDRKAFDVFFTSK